MAQANSQLANNMSSTCKAMQKQIEHLVLVLTNMQAKLVNTLTSLQPSWTQYMIGTPPRYQQYQVYMHTPTSPHFLKCASKPSVQQGCVDKATPT